jgi:hypothetical protein
LPACSDHFPQLKFWQQWAICITTKQRKSWLLHMGSENGMIDEASLFVRFCDGWLFQERETKKKKTLDYGSTMTVMHDLTLHGSSC